MMYDSPTQSFFGGGEHYPLFIFLHEVSSFGTLLYFRLQVKNAPTLTEHR